MKVSTIKGTVLMLLINQVIINCEVINKPTKIKFMKFQKLNDKNIILRNNFELPILGIGTLRLEKNHLKEGLRKGLRLIDTAKAYGNEEMVGEALEMFSASKPFVITKLCRENLENKEVLIKSIEDSIVKLKQVPDLFLIHGPYPDIALLSIIQELEELKKIGLVKEWGVSNFEKEHIEILIEHGMIPVLNQVEYHPFFQRPELLEYCNHFGIVLQAYRPLIKGVVLDNSVLQALAKKYEVCVASLIYSWLVEQGIPIVTKVSLNEHQQEYVESKIINLSDEDTHLIKELNKPDGIGRTCTRGGWFVPFDKEKLVLVWQGNNKS